MTNKQIIIEKEITQESINELRSDEQYQHFAEGLRAEIVETEFNIREEVYKLYHSIGKQIAENTEYFTRANVYGNNVAEVIAIDVKKSPRTIWYAMQFYKTYPNLEEFVSKQGKDLSWYKITQKFLSKPKLKATTEILMQEEEQQRPQQKQEEEASLPLVVNLDTVIFTLREMLELFLRVKNSDANRAFVNQIRGKFKIEEIKIFIEEYSEGRTESVISLLKELEMQMVSAEYVTESFIEDEPARQAKQTVTKNKNKTKEPPLTPQLIARFEQLYYQKYNYKPSINNTTFMICGRRLKEKLKQGYSFDDILALLQIYANSKDSDPKQLGFNLITLFSDSVFNKMQSLKSKGSSKVLEDKYGKF